MIVIFIMFRYLFLKQVKFFELIQDQFIFFKVI